MNNNIRTIHSAHTHTEWNHLIPPVATIAPGESLEFETIEASGGQLSPTSTARDIEQLDFGNLNPVTGPIFIDGAQAGDALKVSILDLSPSGWGWTATIPGFGLLADDFPEPAINIWKYDATNPRSAAYGPGGHVPLKPFCGTIGVAPREPGGHSMIPPRPVGGNMDCRDLSMGTELYLPVEVTGALFSVGDTHAAQGDGEVCGSALESPMNVALKFDLIKGANLPAPQFTTPGPVTRHLDSKGYHVTMGIGPDLMQATRDSVRAMIDLLGREHHLDPQAAYMLCSVCADLRISEVVDQPNWVVSYYFPRIVFE